MDRNVKLVAFDLDGTLIDAYRPVVRSLTYVMKQLGLKVPDSSTIRRTVGRGDRHLVESFVGAERIEKGIKLYRAHHKESLLKGSKLLPGAKKLLTALKKRGYNLVVASNRPDQYSRIVMKHLEIMPFFDYVLCGDKAARPKPYPDILKQILIRFSLNPSEAIYVGDMGIDIETGKRARIKTVVVTTGSSSLEELEKMQPFAMIERLDGVIPLLEELE